MRTYLDIARTPGLRTILLVGLLLRIPLAGGGVLLTLHVVTTLGASYAQAGLVGAVYTVAGAIAGPWRGRLLDRIGLRRTMLPSLIIVPIVWSIAAWLPYVGLIVLAAIGGVFAVPVFSIVRQVIVATAPAQLRRSALALDSTVTELSFMIGPALAVLLTTVWPTSWAIIVYYVGGALACIWIYALNPPLVSGEHEDAPLEHGRWLTMPGGLAIALMFGGILVLGACDVSIVGALRALNRSDAISWVLVLWSLGSCAGGIIFGAWRRSVPAAVLLFSMSLITMTVALPTSPLTLGLLLCASGLTCAPLISATVDDLSRTVPPRRLGEAMGWHAAAGTAGGALGAPLAGLIIDHAGWPSAFVAAGAAGIVIALLGGALGLRYRRPAVTPAED